MLHLTTNPNSTGSKILCGVERNQTYRTMADGTADRYVDRVMAARFAEDPELCPACVEVHATMPAAALPAWLMS